MCYLSSQSDGGSDSGNDIDYWMSSGSESDEEYVPGEPEQLSEVDSADDETEQQYENEQEKKATKRKHSQKKRKTGGKRSRSEVIEDSREEEEEPVPEQKLNPEEEKKREDDLWAKFLEGTETKRKVTASVTSPTVEKKEPEIAKVNQGHQNLKAANEERDKRIFEFAGETIVVEDNMIKERLPTAPEDNSPSAAASASQSSTLKPKKAGLGNLLGQLNKKNTLSVLEKSKLDWNTYKKQEGVEDEVKSHNKGKQGFLDRRDFLERADLRQYEIERDLRMSKRSNR